MEALPSPRYDHIIVIFLRVVDVVVQDDLSACLPQAPVDLGAVSFGIRAVHEAFLAVHEGDVLVLIIAMSIAVSPRRREAYWVIVSCPSYT